MAWWKHKGIIVALGKYRRAGEIKKVFERIKPSAKEAA